MLTAEFTIQYTEIDNFNLNASSYTKAPRET